MPVRDLIGKRGQAMKTKPAARGRSNENAIFARILKANDGDLPPKLARYILTLGFDEEDQERMRELALRNQDGRLSVDEKEELQNFVKAGHLLALLHSKARKSLKQRKVC